MDKIEWHLALLNKLVHRGIDGYDPELFIDKLAYDGSGNVEYIGYAKQGSATSAAVWRVAKLSYDGSNRYTGSTISQPDQVWDDRATLTYT